MDCALSYDKRQEDSTSTVRSFPYCTADEKKKLPLL